MIDIDNPEDGDVYCVVIRAYATFDYGHISTKFYCDIRHIDDEIDSLDRIVTVDNRHGYSFDVAKELLNHLKKSVHMFS
jgi:hypothetical protein